MCLGVPMQIIEIDGYLAQCEAKGIRRKVSLFLLQHETIAIGDFVLVHVGNAIQKMSEHEAQSTWELYDEILGDEMPSEEISSEDIQASDAEVSGNA